MQVTCENYSDELHSSVYSRFQKIWFSSQWNDPGQKREIQHDRQNGTTTLAMFTMYCGNSD